MSIVRTALQRPISVLVVVVAIALSAVMAAVEMPRDILPSLGIPTIYVAQPYGGLSPSQMESYITYYYEYHFLYISGIEHIESRNIASTALIKLQFYPGTDMAAAEAETVSNVDRSRAFMPPGTVPPFVIRYDAGSAPVGNLVFSGEHRSLGELQNMALNSVRPLFATLKGVSSPPPFGASARTIVVNVDPAKLRKYALSAAEVASAIASGNSIVPAGNIPVGNLYPIVPVNSVVRDIQGLLDIPIRTGTIPTVYLRDIGNVQDSTDIPTCYALINGKRTVYIPVTKSAEASTLSVVNLVKSNIPRFEAVLPPDVKISYEFDQSVYVRAAIRSLLFEGVLGALLTGVMVLLFLRDLRSVMVVLVNIPLSLMSAIFALWVSRQTLNVMTLGGLALAVGILVDETTVTIENIHVHLANGKSAARAGLEATMEILKPALLTLLCVLSVFIPSFFMHGVAKALFVPLTLAVGFAMVASFVLSMTVVPALCTRLLRYYKKKDKKAGRFSFEGFRDRYSALLRALMTWKKPLVLSYLLATLSLSALLLAHIGREIFPSAEEGQFKVRIRAPTGTRLEATESITKQVLAIIEQTVGKSWIHSTLAFVGQQPPEYPINDVFEWTSGTQEAVVQVALKKGNGIEIGELKERLRKNVQAQLPQVRLSFEPGGLIDSMMSQGAPTPIEVSVNGPNLAADHAFAETLRRSMEDLPFLRDLQYGQVYDYPSIVIDVNRPLAGARGATPADVGRAVIPATSSTRFVQPIYWEDVSNGINYQVQIQIPQGSVTSIADLNRLPVSVNAGAIPLHRLAKIKAGTEIGEYDRVDLQRMLTLTANLSGMDLGHAAAALEQKLKPLLGNAPRGVEVHYRGQIASLNQMFEGLTIGLGLAVAVIFLMLAGNFESLPLSLAIILTLPAVLCGSLLGLLLTGTTLNIESFMGTIMAIGVSVANSILLVTFAERHRLQVGDSERAAIEGARSRLRPILMTSLAMLIGMIPMSLGLGDGGKETAPLGRAVMGGLSGSTLTTLLVLPLIFAIIQKKRSQRSASMDPDDPSGLYYEEPKGEKRWAA